MQIINMLILEAILIFFWSLWLHHGTNQEKLWWGSLLILFFGPVSLFLVFCTTTCSLLFTQPTFLLPFIVSAGAVLLLATIARVTAFVTKTNRRKKGLPRMVVPGTLFMWCITYILIFLPLFSLFSTGYGL